MFLEYIKQALKSAKYHEDKAFFFAHPNVNQYDKVVIHLRAYFWELWSVCDYILQLVNSKTLNLQPELVRRDFFRELKKKKPDYKYLSILEEIQSNERLIRVKDIRDHAHKWQVDPYLVEYNGDVVNIVAINNLNRRDRRLPKQINIDRNDLWFMKKTVDDLSQKGFFKSM